MRNVAKVALPQSWTSKSLDDLADVLAGNPAPQGEKFFSDDGPPFVRVVDMGRLDGKTHMLNTRDRLSDEGIRGLKLFRKDSVLLTKSGASTLLNQRALLGQDSYVVSHISVVEAGKATVPEWLFYFLKTVDAADLAHGGNMPSLPLRFIKEIETPVAPLNEQQRIVEKIETLFARLDKGEEAVRDAQKLLTQYSQSVLKSAVTGQLTADWRAEHAGQLELGRDHYSKILESRRVQTRGRLRKPVDPNISEMPPIPEHWTWVSLDSLVYDGPTNGVSPKSTTDEGGVKSFKLTATTSGRFIISDKTVKVVGISIEPDSKFWLKTGDMLIQRGNTIEYVGTAAIFPGPDDEYIYPDLMMRLRFTDELISRWATTWINFEYAKQYFRSHATGIAGNMPKINGTTLRALAVPLPPRNEIEECMDKVEEEMAKNGPVERFCETELKRSTSLRQSILKDAFAGKLVPQDPADEPASALLARIAAEKPTAKKTRRKMPA